MNFTPEEIQAIVSQSREQARLAAEQALARWGDRDACGFAWCEIFHVKGNTRLGKMLKAAGVRQGYERSWQLWNPSGLGVQSVSVLEAGAQAAAEVFRKHGFTAYANSRLD
jgi:hypothetical protein